MRESNDSNAVEVNGICFETLMPERVLRLPRKKRGINTPVQLGIGITNNTQETLHFSFYSTLTLKLVKADEKALRAGLEGVHLLNGTRLNQGCQKGFGQD